MINKIKAKGKEFKFKLDIARQGLTFKIFCMWVCLGLPLLTIWKITGLIINLHDYSAELYNKLDDKLSELRNV